MRISIIAVLLLLSAAAAQAQTWEELRAMRKKTTVRVYEPGGAHTDGKLLLVKDDELTILRGRRPLVIPKASIARVERRHRDSPVEGAVIGALVNIGLGLLGGWQGCSDSKCAAVGIPAYATIGALIDWQMLGRRTVYKTP